MEIDIKGEDEMILNNELLKNKLIHCNSKDRFLRDHRVFYNLVDENNLLQNKHIVLLV